MEGKEVKKEAKSQNHKGLPTEVTSISHSFHFSSLLLPSTVRTLLISVPPPTYSQTSLQEFNQMYLMARSKMQMNFGPLTCLSPLSFF